MNEILNPTISWIEAHEHTVELLKWLTVGLIAWSLGIFRVLREWTSRPSISINPAYSHCYYEVHSTLGSHTDIALLTLVIDVELSNPTNHPAALRMFEVRIKKKGHLGGWTKAVKLVGFPAMPRTPMPSGNEKIVPLWLTTFEEFGDELCLKKVDSQDVSAGLAFFTVGVHKDMLPELQGGCMVQLTATLVSGTVRCAAPIKVRTDLDHLERMIPGSVQYVQHPNVWTLTK
jgi:hypothetical protein